jgi:hypothetical protein
MNRLLIDLLMAIGLIVAIVWASAVLIGAHAQQPEPWQLGCKIRTGIGVAAIALGCLSAGAILGLVACRLLRMGADR